ncbi:2-oxo acid dehydrogenase subunit E2 [Adhaeribacter terreus]|uniref:Dihydrolipoamide acetyltransferase component of pyruvate dehydrogenase complex n=1 Tax=Adhaeribacter terreus TaxID=529703 RepID=A0ABW0E6K6_9BACT
MPEFRMPSLGADMESGFLQEWRVKPGDQIKKGDIIAEVETQKGIIEIECFEEGIIGKLLIKEDEKVPVGSIMATIISPSETAPNLPSAGKEEASAVEVEKTAISETEKEAEPTPKIQKGWVKTHHLRASPLARRIAAEKGIDMATVHGTGPEGAIVREDVEHAIAAQTSPKAKPETAPPKAPAQPETQPKIQPEIATPEAGKTAVAEPQNDIIPEEKTGEPEVKNAIVLEEKTQKPATGFSPETIRMAVAAAMSKSNLEIPHYYLETKIDMTKALAWLSERNKQRPVKERLLPAALLFKAVAQALNDVPDLNATWENGLQRQNSIHIGYVVSLRTGGIIVPAIHDADLKTSDEIMQALNDLIPRARALRLRSSELADSTITVTSLGEVSVETVYGVIYPPQVALVGFGGITLQPWAENGMLDVRPVLTATLAADHRASDGSTGSKFLTFLKNYLQQPETL